MELGCLRVRVERYGERHQRHVPYAQYGWSLLLELGLRPDILDDDSQPRVCTSHPCAFRLHPELKSWESSPSSSTYVTLEPPSIKKDTTLIVHHK